MSVEEFLKFKLRFQNLSNLLARKSHISRPTILRIIFDVLDNYSEDGLNVLIDRTIRRHKRALFAFRYLCWSWSMGALGTLGFYGLKIEKSIFFYPLIAVLGYFLGGILFDIVPLSLAQQFSDALKKDIQQVRNVQMLLHELSGFMMHQNA